MQDRFKYKVKFEIDREVEIFDVTNLDIERGQVFFKREDGQYYNIGIGCEDVELIQCTGLKDKNGKLIYEGDLLRYPAKDKDEATNFVICEVFFHNNDCCDTHIGFQMNRFHFKGNLCGIINYARKYNFIPENVEKMEVIGNIYENPELL